MSHDTEEERNAGKPADVERGMSHGKREVG